MALCTGAAGAQSPVGVFDAQTDIGRVRRAGSASYDPQRQAYLIAGSGQNMWGDHDDFHFVWKRMTGNFILSTRARFAGAGVEAHRKLGWTIRPSLEPNGAHVTAGLVGLISVFGRGLFGQFTKDRHLGIEAVAIYWHFVDIVWIFLFPFLYLIHGVHHG